MSNRNRKVISTSNTKKDLNVKILILITPFLVYLLVLLYCSFISDSPRLSLALAFFSLAVTISFESYEWVFYKIHKTPHEKHHIARGILKYSGTAFNFSVFLFLATYTVICILSFVFDIHLESYTKLPNIITAATLLVYFASLIHRTKLREELSR